MTSTTGPGPSKSYYYCLDFFEQLGSFVTASTQLHILSHIIGHTTSTSNYSGFRVDGTNTYMSFRWGSI